MRHSFLAVVCSVLTVGCDAIDPPRDDDSGLRVPDRDGALDSSFDRGPRWATDAGLSDSGGMASREDGSPRGPADGAMGPDAATDVIPCRDGCHRIADCLPDLPQCVEAAPAFDEACQAACPDIDPAASCATVLEIAAEALEPLERLCVPADCAAEVCNGADDDCDGRVDEGDRAIGSPCGAGDGECAREGQVVCIEGRLTCDAEPGRPIAERCNMLDDDCDGEADEAFGEVGERCVVGTGTCTRDGRVICDAAGGTTCDARPGEPRRELCDGRDDDCDGRIDESFPVGRACDAGIGMCLRPGTMRCDGVGAVCDARPGPPQPEVCDGRDGDCDGRVDEDNPGRIIVRNNWQVVPLFSASCNLVLQQFPVMYVAVDCHLDDPGCEWAAAEGGGAVEYRGPPGRHRLHVRCCQSDGTQCFGQNRQCSFPGSDEVFWCACSEGQRDVDILQCGELDLVGCSP